MSENVEIIEVEIVPAKEAEMIKYMYIALLATTVISLIPAIFTQAVGILVWIGALVFAYIRRGDTNHEGSKSHYSNYITVFWVGLAGVVAGFVFFLIPLIGWIIGFVVLFATMIWELYRLIKGLLRILESRPFY